MSDDLVKRLRDLEAPYSKYRDPESRIMREAADALDAGDAHIAALRQALANIAKIAEHGMPADYDAWLTTHDQIAAIARCALAAGEKG